MEKAGNPANPSAADPDDCSHPDSRSELATPMALVPSKAAGKKNRNKNINNSNNQKIIRGECYYVALIMDVQNIRLLKLEKIHMLIITDPSKCSPEPLNDLAELEAFCGNPNTNNSEQDQLVLPESVKAITPGAYVHADSSTPLGDVQGEEVLNFNSNSDGISVDTQESKLKNLSPLAYEVATRIKVLLRVDDKCVHQDEALQGQASPWAANINPRMQDSSIKEDWFSTSTECRKAGEQKDDVEGSELVVVDFLGFSLLASGIGWLDLRRKGISGFWFERFG
ncbi:hypothetical protein Nepgr_030834 [Nepenthes gracilis]|uniref:Uncharacterized protein n=1 Tax=Nepenthes gracilis TaxID=150966 RepID=A0AAD3TGZ5_NEPGR|nr:hypothetical protein Nepgr_030834 [Nepenthes gracilis]